MDLTIQRHVHHSPQHVTHLSYLYLGAHREATGDSNKTQSLQAEEQRCFEHANMLTMTVVHILMLSRYNVYCVHHCGLCGHHKISFAN